MERPRSPKKSLSRRKARSLDRSQDPRKDLESWDSLCRSLPATPSTQAHPWMVSDGSRHPESPAQPAEAQGTTDAALSLEETKEFLLSEQRPPQDTKKDKAQRRGQQGWLKCMLNVILRTTSEETKEKANRRAKGKEGLPQPAETSDSPGQPAARKKAHEKKASRKKRSSKKHSDEKTKGAQDQEAEGQEAGLPKMATDLHTEEANLGPVPRGGEDSDRHQSLLNEGQGDGFSKLSSQATDHLQEEEFKKLDEDTIIRMIVRLLQKVGDQWEEEQWQASQAKVIPQNPAPASRKKSQEKRPNLKRAFCHKKHGTGEPKRAGAADISSPDSQLPKKSGYLFSCIGGHRSSITNSFDLEEAEIQEASSTDRGGPSSSDLSPQAGCQDLEEDLQLDRALEFKEFIQKIIDLLQDAEEQEGEKQLQVPEEPDVAVENLASPCRKKSQEKKSSFRKAFSHKKHTSKESKRVEAAGGASLESQPPKRPSYLFLCVGGHRSSISSSLDLDGPEFRESSPAEAGSAASSEAPAPARSHKPEGRPSPDAACESTELIIQKLVALLQEVDNHLGEQIRRHPSFKRFFYQLPDSSLKKLAATLRRKGALSTELDRNLAERSHQVTFSIANKFVGKNFRSVLRLTGLHYSQHRYPQLPYREAQQNITSPETQSPD